MGKDLLDLGIYSCSSPPKAGQAALAGSELPHVQTEPHLPLLTAQVAEVQGLPSTFADT